MDHDTVLAARNERIKQFRKQYVDSVITDLSDKIQNTDRDYVMFQAKDCTETEINDIIKYFRERGFVCFARTLYIYLGFRNENTDKWASSHERVYG